MGGNALKNCETRRYKKDEYNDLVKEVIQKLNNIPEITKKQVPFSYRDKESFGDLDIVIVHNCYDLKGSINKEFNPKEIVSNGDCLSFEYKEFQIDLIKSSIEHFNTTLEYLNWNDLGNIIGRVAHKFGLKYGHKGLSYIIKNESGYKPRELLISKDIRKILEFLGFNFSKYTLGFDTLNDIYRYVRYSEFFNSDIFSFEEMNHTNRVRNKKRSTYQGFIDYLNNQHEVEKSFLKYYFNGNKSIYLDRINYYFPEVDIFGFIESYNKDLELDKKVKEKFNGEIVSKITGLQGKELGQFIAFYKNRFTTTDEYFGYTFEFYIIESTSKQIENSILFYLNIYNKKTLTDLRVLNQIEYN